MPKHVRLGILLFGISGLISLNGAGIKGWAFEHVIPLSSFQTSTRLPAGNQMPPDWELKVWQGDPEVEMITETKGTVLRLRSHKSCIVLYKEIQVDPSRYPSLSWEWEVTEWPAEGDARDGSRDDQAAGIYVVFPRFPAFFNSRIIGYVWESHIPENTIIKSRNDPRVHYVVIRSGQSEAGQWVPESRNVWKDYERIFGEEPPPVGGVSLVIDSDHTQSSSESYFGEIYFSGSEDWTGR